MKLLTPKYLPEYRKRQRSTLAKHIARLERKGAKDQGFRRWAVVAGAVASSQIEGSSVTVDEYVEATDQDIRSSRDLLQVRELNEAYSLATKLVPNEANLLKLHGVLANTISGGRWKPGQWRDRMVYVMETRTFIKRTVYTGPEPTLVPALMRQLMDEVGELRHRKLDNSEVFYYAALLHLQFVEIHPFSDGNGRMARLLEKWFMAQHLGPVAWWINSELYYRMHPALYYRSLRDIGATWDTVDLYRAMPFLLLLPRGLQQK